MQNWECGMRIVDFELTLLISDLFLIRNPQLLQLHNSSMLQHEGKAKGNHPGMARARIPSFQPQKVDPRGPEFLQVARIVGKIVIQRGEENEGAQCPRQPEERWKY